MGALFYGWRRKVGVLTLVMACVSMAGWVRSFGITDMVVFPSKKVTNGPLISFNTSSLISASGSVIWARLHHEYAEADVDFDRESYPIWITYEPLTFQVKWGCCGFDTWELSGENNGRRATFLQIPYCSIVCPLVVLSAFLLLSKSRKPTQNELNEPISAMEHEA